MEFIHHISERDEEAFIIIQGDCPTCGLENSLILMKQREITKTKHKLNFRCINCDTEFKYTVENRDTV